MTATANTNTNTNRNCIAIDVVGKDVATVLGYKNSSNALVAHVDDEDKTAYRFQVSGSNYKANTAFISESGLYALILLSKLPN